MSGFNYGNAGDFEAEDEFLPEGVNPEALKAPTARAGYRYDNTSAQDPGPFYLFSPGEDFVLREMHDNMETITPVALYPVTNQVEWVDVRYIDNHSGRVRSLPSDPDFKEGEINIFASAIRDNLLAADTGFAVRGLVEIASFAKQSPGRFALARFNQAIAPVHFVADYTPNGLRFHVPDGFEEAVAREGVLAIRKKLASEARALFASRDFKASVPAHIPSLYLAACDEILSAFNRYENYANAYLDAQDRAVKESDKKGYDDRDRHIMWLLARQGVDTALTRALNDKQQIVVQMPEMPQAPALVDPATMATAIAMALQILEEQKAAKAEGAKAEAPARRSRQQKEALTDEPGE